MKPSKYWLRLLKLFRHYRKKSTYLPYFPVRIWIELTSVCNYRCIMCPNKDLKKDAHGFMDFSLYKKILDEAEDFIFEVNLAHRGESLLHPQIVEMIDYAQKKNVYTRLHTNGSLLTEELSHKIIEVGLDRISFSFDGYEKKTYENIRVGGDFDKTIANIVRFLEIKKEAHSKKPLTAIEVIHFNHKDIQNSSDVEEKFKSQFKDLPLDSFVTKGIHNWAGQLKKESREGKYTACPFPWNALIIFWDGTVLPCTQDFFGDFTVGSLKDSSLKEIWNGERIRHLRKKLAEGDIKELKACSHCDRPWREGILGVPKEYLWKFIFKRMP